MDDSRVVDFDVIKKTVRDALQGDPPEVSDSLEFPDITGGGAKRKWYKLDEIVVVFADLKNSTKLGINKYNASTARIYEASTKVGVQLLWSFHPKFLEVQGDGFFGVFHGEKARLRAMTTAMMLGHFSKYILEPQIKSTQGSSCPDTGLKIGVASGPVLVKQIGINGSERPVWAGKPVNYAAKCAEFGKAHEVIITEQLYQRVVQDNDYFLQPCYHHGHPKEHFLSNSGMWRLLQVSGVPSKCLAREVPWCDGNRDGKETAVEFAQDVLAGKRERNKSWADRNVRS